jgi:hypothetical protein
MQPRGGATHARVQPFSSNALARGMLASAGPSYSAPLNNSGLRRPVPLGSVVSFEPVPQFRAFFEYNIARNQLQDRVQVGSRRGADWLWWGGCAFACRGKP